MPKDVNGIGCVLDSNAAAEPERLEAVEEVIGRSCRESRSLPETEPLYGVPRIVKALKPPSYSEVPYARHYERLLIAWALYLALVFQVVQLLQLSHDLLGQILRLSCPLLHRRGQLLSRSFLL